MHPTNRESMLLAVQQEDPDSSKNDSEEPSNVSEDELDMILATMGTTSLKDSELELLQNDVSANDDSAQSDAQVIPELPAEEHAPPEPEAPVENVALAQEAPPEEAVLKEVSSTERPPQEASPEPSTEEPLPASRNTARRVVQRFFNKLRKVI